MATRTTQLHMPRLGGVATTPNLPDEFVGRRLVVEYTKHCGPTELRAWSSAVAATGAEHSQK
jgi:hypothetical protein